jgi:hypothetical protein
MRLFASRDSSAPVRCYLATALMPKNQDLAWGLFISKSEPDLLLLKCGEKDRNLGQPSNFSFLKSSKIFARKKARSL